MMQATYIELPHGENFVMSSKNWGNASSEIFIDGEPTGRQVADFRHNERKAIEELILHPSGYTWDDEIIVKDGVLTDDEMVDMLNVYEEVDDLTYYINELNNKINELTFGDIFLENEEAEKLKEFIENFNRAKSRGDFNEFKELIQKVLEINA